MACPLAIACPAAGEPRHYRLAGLHVLSNCALPHLPPAPSPAVETAALLAIPPSVEGPPAVPYIRVHGPLGGRVCRVAVARTPHGYHLDIEGAGVFWVGATGSHIQADPTPGVDIEGAAFVEALLGPPLMLAFVLRELWTLHASAALIRGNLVAFAADSGAGKSTLARALDAAGLRRVADDILPITVTGEQVYAWPHFPQLKVPPDQQPSRGLPERLPLHTLYQLDSSAPSGGDLTPVPLPPRAATTVLLRHTVATRLFDHDLLRRHFGFAGQTARYLRVCRLPYPRRLEMLPAVIAALDADLAP